MKESARYILQILVFVALILTFGTSGYLLIEDGITAPEAFYMALTAITPTQFHEVHRLSVPGRYFTVILVFCGFGAVVAFATQFARLVIQSELEGVGIFTRKQMQRRIRRMKNHYIVCGFGEIGSAICSELRNQQLSFVIIANNETAIEAINREGYPFVRGNPTADTSLREAGIDRAVGLLSVLPDDTDNLVISLAARELNPKIFIIARGEETSVEDRMLRAGADIVVSPMKLGGHQIAELIKQRAGVSSYADGAAPAPAVFGLSMNVYHHASDEPTTVADVLRETSACGAAGLQRTDETFIPTPAPGTAVQKDDTVIVITRSGSTESFQKKSTGRTILLADDHRALRLLFSRKLAAAGHDVLQAGSGEEAVRLARAHRPDLVVLDVNMPDGNGYDVCEELRKTERFTTVPIILYSGEDTDEFIERGRAAGADMCIRKTSKSTDLLARIEEAFAHLDEIGRLHDTALK
ncbi:NAD-binding protein [Maioricimonas sp. JC845]|uniref:NAD-binding protein n=1 Tax=Maioricimonas sp. JC845 TaxID=3232138 RepID=UPI003458A745